MLDGIRAACGDARPCQLRPLQLFLAWNGVLVLVYEGFPDSLAGIKGRLAPRYGRENFGSRWPKTTLAATSDTAPELALPELERLRTLCVAHSAGLPSEPVLVKGVEVVEYKWRSLEADGAPQRAAIPLPGGGGANGGSSGSSVGEEERERVCGLDEPEMYPRLARDTAEMYWSGRGVLEIPPSWPGADRTARRFGVKPSLHSSKV